MDVVDFTGADWPVYASQIKWDDVTSNVDAQYAGDGSGCGHHCVGAKAIYPNEDPLDLMGSHCARALGYATVGGQDPIDGNNHFLETVRIRYNKTCADGGTSDLTQSERRALTCQEQGHALGLDHRDNPVSCMYQDPRVAPLTPDEHDSNALDGNIYDHAN